MPVPGILIADDDPVARDLLAEVLAKEGYRVRAAAGGRECLELARSGPVDLALLDLRMPDLDGLEVLRQIQALHPGVPILILTAFATLETAIEAIRAGAYDYLSKPFRMEEIRLVVRRALEQRRLAEENVRFRQALRDRYRFENVVGLSPRMVEIYRLAARAAATDATVLLLGETGTGKELIARAIHQGSARAEGPFIAVDCTALPEALFESELFGHARGAFTGAVTTKRGLLENARGARSFSTRSGISHRPRPSSFARSRAEIRRVGGGDDPVDVRSSRRPTDPAARRGGSSARTSTTGCVSSRSRSAARARREDIPLLAQHFLESSPAPAPRRSGDRAAARAPGRLRLAGQRSRAGERHHPAATLSSAAVLMPEDLRSTPRRRPPPARRSPGGHDARGRQALVREPSAGGRRGTSSVRRALGVDRRTLYRILARPNRTGGPVRPAGWPRASWAWAPACAAALASPRGEVIQRILPSSVQVVAERRSVKLRSASGVASSRRPTPPGPSC
jgi:CheY-like chemotaxis protein